MKPKIRTPYFEIGTKNYIYGDKVLKYARAADAAAKRYDIDVLFITPAVEIRRVVENTQRLIVLAPYMDTLRPGRGMADILPEALKAAGAQGVVINHCEKPMSLQSDGNIKEQSSHPADLLANESLTRFDKSKKKRRSKNRPARQASAKGRGKAQAEKGQQKPHGAEKQEKADKQ